MDKTFNQLIIIGNGFDLACGLESSYQAFFDNRFGDLEFNNYSDYEKIADDSTKIPHKNVWDLIFLFEKSHSSSRLGEIVEWQDVEKVISRWLAPDGIPSIRTVLGQLTNLDINSIKALSGDNETEPNDLAYLLQGITRWILKTSTHDENTSTINKRSIEAEIFNSFNESALNRPWREKERAFNNFWQLEEAWSQWYKVQKSDEQIESRYQLPFFDIGDPWVDWYITNPNSGLCRFFLNQLKEFETAFAEYVKSKQNIHPEYNTNAIKLADDDAEIDPVPTGNGTHIDVPEMDPLSVTLSDFNDIFGNIDWNDADNVRKQILEIPAMVSRDENIRTPCATPTSRAPAWRATAPCFR